MRNAFKIIEIPLNNTRPNTNTHIHTHLDMVNDMKNDTNQVNVPLFSIATTEKNELFQTRIALNSCHLPLR